jgi:hypothetical protein
VHYYGEAMLFARPYSSAEPATILGAECVAIRVEVGDDISNRRHRT